MIGNVLIFSYNRPRMLREAIDSVLVDQIHKDVLCWVIDDGSDFDVEDLYNEYKDERLIIAKAPKISLEQRIDKDSTRFVDNVNYIMEHLIGSQFVTFLCDDDILAPDLLAASSIFFEQYNYHLFVGNSYYFYDGQDPIKEGRKGFKGVVPPEMRLKTQKDLLWWNLGCFTHRTECFLEEGQKWRKREEDAHSWDIDYIKDLWALHPGYVRSDIPAVYRREHKNALSVRLGRLYGDPMSEDSKYVLLPKILEPEDVAGWME